LTLGIIIAVMYFQASVESNNSNIAFDQARNLIESWRKRFLLGSDGSEEKLDSWGVLVAAISRYGEKIASQKEIQIRLMKDRLDKTTQAVVERDRHLSDLQEKLTGMSDLASLKEQLQHSSSSFLNKMQEVRSHCEDIFDLASKGLATSGKGLQEFTKRWQAGVEDSFHKERGARKFFRTLSETPGSRVGLTKLDDDLSDLVTLSSSALDQTLHIAMLSRQVLAELEEGVQVAALWQGLAMRDFQKDQTCDWRDCLNAAQRLVGADGRYGSLTFESMPNVQNPEELYLPITKVSLISGFFHLYMALLADVTIDAISMPIVLRQKRISDQGTIIFSLPHPAHDVADSAPGRGQQYHMEIAKAILGPAGVRVSFLPPTVAGVPVAVMWPLPTRQVEIVPTAEPTRKIGKC
ncbi:MAG: hypothetical protein NT027_06365, partial [Proteobacteria bacterium]|nr:hypothetical protein [Pseudomonadota bacterium]